MKTIFRVSFEKAPRASPKGLDESALWVCLWLKINGLSVTQQKRKARGQSSRERDYCALRRSNRETTVDEKFTSCEVEIAKFLYFWNVWTATTSNAQQNLTVPSETLLQRPLPGWTMTSPHVYEWLPFLADICRGICQFKVKQNC